MEDTEISESNIPENYSHKMEILETQLNSLESELNRSSNTESSLLKAIGWGSGALAFMFTVGIGLNYLSIQKELDRFQLETDKLISDTETRVTELLGNAIPFGADIRDFTGSKNGEVIAGVFIAPSKVGETPIWRLSIKIKIKAHVKGEVSGRLVGYEYFFSSDIADALVPLTSSKGYASADILDTHYIDIPPNGIIVSPFADVPINPSYTISASSCDEVQAIHDLLESSHTINISLRPIFEAIRNEPTSSKFRIKFVSNSIFRCPPE